MTGVVVNGNIVEENHVLAHQNLALAIVAAEQKKREQDAGYVNRSLKESLHWVLSDKQRLVDINRDLEDRLANCNSDLISQLQEHIDDLEESAVDASYTIASLNDNIFWLEDLVNRECVSAAYLDLERSKNLRLDEENCSLIGEIHRLQGQIINLRASGAGKGSNKENPLTMELTSSCAAGVLETLLLEEDSMSDDNLSLFPSDDDDATM